MASGGERQARLTWRKYGLKKRGWNALIVIFGSLLCVVAFFGLRGGWPWKHAVHHIVTIRAVYCSVDEWAVV